MRHRSRDIPPRPFTGRHMLIVMVSFFGVVIAVNLTMAVLASRTWSGLVVKNGYVASQQFNSRLAAARRQAKLGWASTLEVAGAKLVFTIRDRDGRALSGLATGAKLERPTSERGDAVIAFAEAAPGRYEAAAPAGRGRWVVDLTARSRAGTTYRQIFRIMVK